MDDQTSFHEYWQTLRSSCVNSTQVTSGSYAYLKIGYTRIVVEMVLACSTVSYMGVPLERALRGISKAGYQYVELLSIPNWITKQNVWPSMSTVDLQKVRDLLDDFNLKLMSLSGHVDFLVGKPENVETVVKALKERIELAASMGCKFVNSGAWTSNKKIFYDSVEDVIRACEEHDVTLGLEVGEPGLTATGKRLIELLSKVDSRRIGINYDTGNIRWLTGVEPESDLPYTLSKLVHIHLKDQIGGKGCENYPALGEGEINFLQLFETLKESSFRGPFTVEVEMPCNDLLKRDSEVKRSLDFAQRLLSTF